jgi:hypothetical protein
MRGEPLTSGSRVGLQLAQARQRRIAQLIGADVVATTALRSRKTAGGVDQAGLFLAGFAIAHEFHGASLV